MCVWKGKQGPFMAAEGVDLLLTDIASATTKRLQDYLDKSTPVDRARILGLQAELKPSLADELGDKLSYWRHGVYLAVGGIIKKPVVT